MTGLGASLLSFPMSTRCFIGRQAVSLFRGCTTFCKECKKQTVHVCSRWHWLRYRWNDRWSWWIAWVLIFSQHYKWKEMFCIMCAHLKVPGWSFVCNALLTKSYLCFCHVWMKLVEVAKRFYLYQDHFEVVWSVLEWWILLYGYEDEMCGWIICLHDCPLWPVTPK